MFILRWSDSPPFSSTMRVLGRGAILEPDLILKYVAFIGLSIIKLVILSILYTPRFEGVSSHYTQVHPQQQTLAPFRVGNYQRKHLLWFPRNYVREFLLTYHV